MVLEPVTGSRRLSRHQAHGLPMVAINVATSPKWSTLRFLPNRFVQEISMNDPERIGRNAGERAVERLHPRKVSTKKVPVIFDQPMATSSAGHLVGVRSTALQSRTRPAYRETNLASNYSCVAFASSARSTATSRCARDVRWRKRPGAALSIVRGWRARSWFLDARSAATTTRDDAVPGRSVLPHHYSATQPPSNRGWNWARRSSAK